MKQGAYSYGAPMEGVGMVETGTVLVICELRNAKFATFACEMNVRKWVKCETESAKRPIP